MAGALIMIQRPLLRPFAWSGWARRLSTPAKWPQPRLVRSDFPHFERRQTRWNDNDGEGPSRGSHRPPFMDDAVNAHLLQRGVGIAYPRFVAESSCRYFAPLAYPDGVDVGLAVLKLGSSSVSYVIGIFVADDSGDAS
ncbi:hypothetical protein T492DRAFT_831731 [Pavlovales sp. CCMP2436]|nr:hypothetical protein T492DRAFT_831731 [Pavlovales sp. CCMP2436]